MVLSLRFFSLSRRHMNLQRFLHTIDGISTWVGKAAAWLIILLTAVVCVEVFKRYFLNAPTAWIFDFNNMLYGTLFMLAGAHALAQNPHARGGFLYGSFPASGRAGSTTSRRWTSSSSSSRKASLSTRRRASGPSSARKTSRRRRGSAA